MIAPEYEERAKQMRAERDRQYGNIYTEAATDERWVGDLGEMVFNSWFKHGAFDRSIDTLLVRRDAACNSSAVAQFDFGTNNGGSLKSPFAQCGPFLCVDADR